MATVDLTVFDDQGFVIHFGGDTHQIDAVTFGNALVSIAEALRAINHEVNPGHSIEIAIEAVGPGSFRARIKTIKKSLKNLFSGDLAHDLVVALLAAFLWDKVISPTEPPVIIVNDDSVIVEHGGDRIIISKEAYEQKQKIERSKAVNHHVNHAMEVLENDSSVTSFGIARKISDPKPVLDIPRSDFALIRQNTLAPTDDKARHVDHQVVLSIHKAVFERSTRKWEFIWNGFRISAPILDQSFFDRLEKREISLKQGDCFTVTLRVHQVYDPFSGQWVNDRYEVLAVGAVVARAAEQQPMRFTDEEN